MWSLLAALCGLSAASPADDARAHVLRAAALEPGPDHDLAVRAELPWAAGTRVRLRHVLRGVPVEGRDVVVHLDPDGEVRRVVGPVRVRGTLDPTPTVPAADALRAARDVAAHFGRAEAWTPRVAQVAWLDRGDRPHLAWAVDVASLAPFRQWRVLVDAHTGEVLFTRPTSFDARGNVFPSNPVESELTEVELQGLTSDAALDGEHATVLSCADWDDGGLGGLGGGTCLSKTSWAVPDVDGNYLFDSDPMSMEDPLAEVQMYHHLDLISAWFESEVGFRHPRPIQGIVNFPMANAFFGDADGDGQGDVAFGQGLGVDFAYDADVIYHEFVHSVIGSVTSLGFFGADELGVTFAPLALNEGSADLFSLTLTGDPLLGAYAGPGLGGGAIRDLGPDRRCPEDLYGEAHEDGMIWGAMGWNILDDPAVSPSAAMQLFYGTVTGWSDPGMTYAEAAESMLQTADDLRDAGVIDAAAHDAIAAHVDASGLVGCRRIIPLDDGATSTQFVQYIGLADLVGHIPTTAQLSLDVPEGATEARLRIKDWFATGEMGWTVFVRRGEPVRYEVTGVAGFEIPQVAEYDFAVDGEGNGSITLPDPERGLTLEPGATYYFSVTTRNLGGIGGFDLVSGEATFKGSVTCCTLPEPPPEQARACACAAADGAVGWPAVVGLLALVRRRP